MNPICFVSREKKCLSMAVEWQYVMWLFDNREKQHYLYGRYIHLYKQYETAVAFSIYYCNNSFDYFRATGRCPAGGNYSGSQGQHSNGKP